MRKIVVMMSMSLDGFMSGPDGGLDWHLVDDELHRHFNEQLAAMSVELNGRVMFELMAEFWPTADQDPASPPPVVEFARIWRETPKMIFSRTLSTADWNTTVVNAVVPEDILALKNQPGGDMSLGGAELAAEFSKLGLIDEYRIYVHPIVLGAGRPLFPAAEKQTPLQLMETRTFGNGVVMLRYQANVSRAGSVAAQATQ